MIRPTARVLALLEILQGGGTHTAGDLAERLGVDERTVRRYAEHLLDLEVPVVPVRGRFGGYRLAPGFRMPPLMLTDEEALVVLLGLAAIDQEAAESAAAKVRRVLPRPLAARLAELLAKAEPRRAAPGPSSAGPARGAATPEAATMLRLAEATRQRRPVMIAYVDRYENRTERTLHPYGLVATRGRWYVTGPAESGMRTFRLDRIEQVRLLAGSFAVPEDYTPVVADVPWRYRVAVRVQGTPDDVSGRLPPGVGSVEPAGDDWVRVRLRAERLEWLPGILVGLNLPFVVEEPAELRELWAARLAGWVALREDGSPGRAES